MPITLGSKIIFWWSAESWLFTWHVIVNSCSGPPYAEFKMPWRRVASLVVPLPALRSWYRAPQKKCKSWAAPLLWQQSGREQLPDACCYFCLCCWHRGSYGLFTGSCFVSALTCPGSAVSTGTFAPCLWMDTVFVGRCWVLWNLCQLRLCSLVLCKGLSCLAAEFVQGIVYLC